MLLTILRDPSTSFAEKLLYALITAFCVLLSLSIHEMCHGLAAYFMGDKTAKASGRLSLNPISHLDPIGALCLFLFSFGWAKPVPVNPWNFKHKKAGMIITSIAGPLSNFIVAFISMIGVVTLSQITFVSDATFGFKLAEVTYIICNYLTILNIGLGLFNLIPIPPLDGSKILNAILPRSLYFKIMEYERYGFIILILLINLPGFDSFLSFMRSSVIEFYSGIITLFI